MLRIIVSIALSTAMMWGIEVYKVYLSDDVSLNTKTGEYNFKTVSDRFAPETPSIQLAGMYRHAKLGEEVGVTWIAVDAISTPNYTIVDTKMKTSTHEGVLNATFTKGKGPLPIGKYRVDVTDKDGKLLARKPFWVEPSSVGAQDGAPPVISGIVVARSLSVDAQGVARAVGAGEHFSKIGNHISVLAQYEHLKLGSVAAIRWYGEKMKERKPNQLLLEDKVRITRASGIIRDTITWGALPALPDGVYRVEMIYGGKVMAAKRFWIENKKH